MKHISLIVIAIGVTVAGCGPHRKPSSPAAPRPALPQTQVFYDPETGAVVSGPGVVAPRAVFQPRAPYPPRALSDKISGEVFLTIVVDTNGLVESAAVTKSVRKDLDEAAAAAVKTWRFDPASKDGHLVRARLVVTMGFYLKAS